MADKPTKPEILQITSLARTRLFHIEGLKLRFANGVERDYERLKAGTRGAVMVVPIIDDELLLIREYAAGVDDYELAFPKGLIEENESPLAAANREMQEEVGFAANELTILKVVSLAPGYLSHRMTIVLATDLYPSKLPGDEPEEIIVERWPLAELERLVEQEDFTEARSIAAIYLLKQYLAKHAD
jgi:ADP-ribose diphosphatase